MHIFTIFSWLLFTAFLSSMGFAATYDALITNSLSNTVSVVRLIAGQQMVVGIIPVGSDPSAIITNAAMTTAYVTNSVGGTVSVIDVPRQHVIATIPVGANPTLLAITPDGTKVYVTNFNSSTVSVIDATSGNPTSNTVIATIPVGLNPNGVVITPDGTKAYVANFSGSSVSVIDATSGNPTSNTVIATIAVGPEPSPPSITPNGAYVYVADSGIGIGSHSVFGINTATDMVGAVFVLASDSLQGVFITPDGTTAYVPTSSDDDLVYIIDTSTNTSGGSIPVGSEPFDVVFSLDGSTAYVLNGGDGTISVIDVASSTVIGAPIAVGSFTASGALTPDGTALLAAFNVPENAVSIINPLTNTVENSVAVGTDPSYIAFGVSILPPSGLTGKQKKHRFLTQTDILNVISWSAPSSGVVPVVYRIYRDNLNTLIGVVPATGPLLFEDHNRKKGTSYTYYLIGEGAQGEISFAASITVSPNS